MTEYNGDLARGLDSANDAEIQRLTREYEELTLLILEEEDEGKIPMLERDQAYIYSQIEGLRKQGR